MQVKYNSLSNPRIRISLYEYVYQIVLQQCFGFSLGPRECGSCSWTSGRANHPEIGGAWSDHDNHRLSRAGDHQTHHYGQCQRLCRPSFVHSRHCVPPLNAQKPLTGREDVRHRACLFLECVCVWLYLFYKKLMQFSNPEFHLHMSIINTFCCT